MNTETHFCLRVDVDTFEGLKKGIPKCIKFAEKTGCPITMYLSLGKYVTGRNIFRIIKDREKIKITIPPWKRSSIRSIFRGVILPPAKIGDKEKYLLQQYNQSENIEIQPHGFNHVKWSSHFASFSEEKTHEYVDAFIEEYESIFSTKPIANAAPNFQVNDYYFQLLSNKEFKFSSDFQYSHPFSLQPYNVIQLPITEPTIEEFLNQRKTPKQILEIFRKRFENLKNEETNYVCFYVHAIFEPFKLEKLLEDICKMVYRYDLKPTFQSNYYNVVDEYPQLKFSQIQK